MKKLIRNLLMGVSTSFWPMEKASADFAITDFPEFLSVEKQHETPLHTTVNTNTLDKMLQEDDKPAFCQSSIDEVNDLLKQIDEAETNGWAFSDSSTNVLQKVKLDEVDQWLLDPKQPFSSSETNKVSENVSPSLQGNTLSSTDEDIIVKKTQTNVVNSVQAITNDVPVVDEVLSNLEATNKVFDAKEMLSTNAIPEKVKEENQENPAPKELSLEDKNLTTQTVSVVQKTQDKPASKTLTSKKTQKDLDELLNDLKKYSSHPDSKEEELDPVKTLIIGLVAIALGAGTLFAAEKIDRRHNKKHPSKKEEMSFEEPIRNGGDAVRDLVFSEFLPNQPVMRQTEPEKTETPAPVLQEVKALHKTKMAPVPKMNLSAENADEAHKQGVRMLANIKARRQAINRRVKALRTEMEKYHQSESRFLDVIEELEALKEQRNQLTRQHRQARALVKGKEGERIKEERRLLAKEMRLAKKEKDIERIKKVFDKRVALSNQDKALVKAAEAEAKERMNMADWWHGKRLYQQAATQEKGFNDQIRQLKKETGLKKSEILHLEDEIREGLQTARQQKRLALRQMKGRQFTNQKRLLSQKMLEAHRLQDLSLEAQLKEELQTLKAKEKEYAEWSKSVDYAEKRRGVVPATVKKHAARRDKANVWKGYRMLRDLTQGVIGDEAARKLYQKQALSLIGKGYDKSFNYEAERASALKPATLASIYLSHRKQGLI